MDRCLQNLDSAEMDMAVAVMNLMAVERRSGDGPLGKMVRQIRAELLETEARRDAVVGAAQELLTISDALNFEECTFGVDSDS